MKSILAALIPLLLTVFASILAVNNLWWFIILFTIVTQNAWFFFASGGSSIRIFKMHKVEWEFIQSFVSFLCTVFMIIFMFIVVPAWWGILIMVVVNIALPFILPMVSTVASFICSIIPIFLFKDKE